MTLKEKTRYLTIDDFGDKKIDAVAHDDLELADIKLPGKKGQKMSHFR